MTYDLKRINAGTEKSATSVVIQGRFHPLINTDSKVSLDKGNRAAKLSFLRSLNSPIVTAGFQYLLQTSFGDTVARTAVTSHDPSEPISQYLEKKLDPLCRTFGSLLRSNHELTEMRSSGHVDIAPLEPSDWIRVESRHGILNRSRLSKKASEKKHAAASRFMNNQVQWNGERGSVRGYWQKRTEVWSKYIRKFWVTRYRALSCLQSGSRVKQGRINLPWRAVRGDSLASPSTRADHFMLSSVHLHPIPYRPLVIGLMKKVTESGRMGSTVMLMCLGEMTVVKGQTSQGMWRTHWMA